MKLLEVRDLVKTFRRGGRSVQAIDRFSIAIAESSMAVASAILFKQGRWKKQKI